MGTMRSDHEQGTQPRLESGCCKPDAAASLRAPIAAARSANGTADPGTPAARGLYDPAYDKDSCGVGFLADIKGRKSHKIVEDALTILFNLEHRGAVGADPRAGDGAGILVQIPHKFFAKKADELGFVLPAPGDYAVGALFMPHEEAWRREIQNVYAEEVANEGMQLLGWRQVPTDNATSRLVGEADRTVPPAGLHRQGQQADHDG